MNRAGRIRAISCPDVGVEIPKDRRCSSCWNLFETQCHLDKSSRSRPVTAAGQKPNDAHILKHGTRRVVSLHPAEPVSHSSWVKADA
jgi:hypothetical protein